jgi:hypothetical protein
VRFGGRGTDGCHLVLNPLEAVEDDGPVASLDVVEHLGGGEPDRAAGQRQLNLGARCRPAPA